MAYITRELERKFLKLNDFFKVILVTGARQVGKTTMLKHLAGSDRTYVTISDIYLLGEDYLAHRRFVVLPV